MKVLRALIGAALLALLISSTALAATSSGTTTLLGPATSGTAVDVGVHVSSNIPVVPYEYAIHNECFFNGKLSGNPDSTQRDDIINWDASLPSSPYTVMPVYLNSIPSGAICRVFLVRNNTTVKGSITVYPVQ